ncbi:cytochrome C assembly family protein [Methylomonas rivi]|uniref:Cytochrome c biogenesis protein CcsA n=1 Tax=Methylomonas rivi TaxID=2952226 RepID=A0ABT1TZB8_9GAMM|nr:cytochrome c biogenesis protein CcsA [Methylomonas sp. WSC-6]MBS4050139.1 cytochrome c biogenesis protein CcsA [Methylomonas sp.]MCQ8126907.1 cytochrome c biogenesis protein CcsA [Methylomonas sp. WSC-6]
MNSFLVGIISVLSYTAASILIFKELIARSERHRNSIGLAWLGATLHGIYIILIFQEFNSFNFSFFNAATLVALFIVLLLLIAALDKPVENLGIAILPLAAALLGLDMIFPEKSHPISTQNWEMTIHILSSITAFSLLNIAALQAILLAIQDQQLRSHNPKRLIAALPPLQAMETLLFQMIGTGLFFLTVSLFSGFLFIEDLFAQHLVHKTVLSIIAWIIFSSLLLGRMRYGWRGNTAIQWTLVGFILLLLAYFGSKLVLELILKRV